MNISEQSLLIVRAVCNFKGFCAHCAPMPTTCWLGTTTEHTQKESRLEIAETWQTLLLMFPSIWDLESPLSNIQIKVNLVIFFKKSWISKLISEILSNTAVIKTMNGFTAK